MNDGKRMAAVDCRANSGDVRESDRQIQLVVRAAAPASQLDDRVAQRTRIHRGQVTVLWWRNRYLHRRGCQVVIGPFEEIARPAECSDHPAEDLGRLARGNSGIGAPQSPCPVCLDAGEHQHLRAQRQHDFVEPRLAPRVREIRHRFADFHGIAGRQSQRFIHVGDQCASLEPRAGGGPDDAASQGLCLFHRRHEGPGADLDVHYQGVQPCGDLL